jgi:hypothetical protein
LKRLAAKQRPHGRRFNQQETQEKGLANVTTRNSSALLEVMKVMFKPHPWHGISMGDHAPEIVTCYIEIVPTDSVKYEIEKTTGYLKVDRPQRFSSFSPCLYGLIPRTYCGARVAAFSAEKMQTGSLLRETMTRWMCASLPRKPLLTATSCSRPSPLAACACWMGTKPMTKSLPFSKATPYLDLCEIFPSSPKGSYSD